MRVRVLLLPLLLPLLLLLLLGAREGSAMRWAMRSGILVGARRRARSGFIDSAWWIPVVGGWGLGPGLGVLIS